MQKKFESAHAWLATASAPSLALACQAWVTSSQQGPGGPCLFFVVESAWIIAILLHEATPFDQVDPVGTTSNNVVHCCDLLPLDCLLSAVVAPVCPTSVVACICCSPLMDACHLLVPADVFGLKLLDAFICIIVVIHWWFTFYLVGNGTASYYKHQR